MKPGDLVRRIPRYGDTIIYKDNETRYFLRYLRDGEVVCVLGRFHPPHYAKQVTLLRILTPNGIGFIHNDEVEVVQNPEG